MATKYGPLRVLKAPDRTEIASQKLEKIAAQKTNKPGNDDMEKPASEDIVKANNQGKPATESTENTRSAEPTKEKYKKPPPKTPPIIQNCDLCNAILTSPAIVDAHMTSKKHLKRVHAAERLLHTTKYISPSKLICEKYVSHSDKAAIRDLALYRCDICNITLNSQQQKDLHLAGMKHNYNVKKKVERNEMCPPPPPNLVLKLGITGKALASNYLAGGATTETEPSKVVPKQDMMCSKCNITVNSVQQLAQHMSSKKHQLREYQLKLPIPYI